MNRICKKIYLVIIIFILILGIIYWLGTVNIGFGSNLSFFDTAFDEKGSEWFCERYNIKATVVEEGNYMILEDLKMNKKYVLQAEGKFFVLLCNYSNINNITDDFLYSNSLYSASIEYEKCWGEIYKFIIKGIDKKQWEKKGDKNLEFIKIK